MVIVVPAKELGPIIRATLSVLNECGFKTMIVQELDRIPKEKGILLGRHPCRRHNGKREHRRRFVSYERCGFSAIGYADGAEIDDLWWLDLFHKLSRPIKKGALKNGRLDLLLSLEKLRGIGSHSSGSKGPF